MSTEIENDCGAEPPYPLSPPGTEDDELSTFSRAKRARILEGAIKLFLEAGYAATSMNRVASVSGVTKQTIYSHFHDKEGLFVAIIEQVTIKHLEQRFSGKRLEGEPAEVLRSFAEVLAGRRQDEQYIRLLRTVIAESARFPELARLFVRTVVKPGIEMLATYLDTRPELCIKDPQATARIFCGSLIAFLIAQEILHGKEVVPFEIERLVTTLIEQIVPC